MLFTLRALASALLLSTAVFAAAVGSPEHLGKRAQPKGIDVSAVQGNVNWKSVVTKGISFVYIEATVGTSYKNPYNTSQFTGATKAHLLRGTYHFAYPPLSSGAAQANYFVSNGGGWTNDHITLPGIVVVVDPPNGPTCYGLKPTAMVNWIKDFSTTYHHRVGRYPVIHTTTKWWKTCTGNYPGFGSTNPLSLSDSPKILPAGWSHYTFWRYADSGPVPGGQDIFNGDISGLKRFAAS